MCTSTFPPFLEEIGKKAGDAFLEVEIALRVQLLQGESGGSARRERGTAGTSISEEN
jgi:hypothetical protein